MKIFYFDMDDTLLATQSLYEETSKICASRIKAYFNLDESVEEIIEKMNGFDLENVKTLGFSSERFPKSWVQTYEHFSAKKGVRVSPSKRKSIELLASRVFRMEAQVYEGTYETLRALKSGGNTLLLLTAGEKEIQEKRIQAANLSSCFDEIIIAEKKNPEVLKNILNERRHLAKDCAFIGNSLKSDIYPAMEAGMKAIHLNRETWAYDSHVVDTTHKNYQEINNIKEILDIIENQREVA